MRHRGNRQPCQNIEFAEWRFWQAGPLRREIENMFSSPAITTPVSAIWGWAVNSVVRVRGHLFVRILTLNTLSIWGNKQARHLKSSPKKLRRTMPNILSGKVRRMNVEKSAFSDGAKSNRATRRRGDRKKKVGRQMRGNLPSQQRPPTRSIEWCVCLSGTKLFHRPQFIPRVLLDLPFSGSSELSRSAAG